MRWLITVQAMSTGGSHIIRPVRSAVASVPRAPRANASASVYENSPASMLGSDPPAMCWLNEMFCAT